LSFIAIEPPSSERQPAKLFPITMAIRHIEFMTADTVDGIKAKARLTQPETGGQNNVVPLNREQRRSKR
jgi:hypothetical protein